jgi:protein tyrosine phosphatase (PTP) superfamily phosphohydrolase (DUF442 family)
MKLTDRHKSSKRAILTIGLVVAVVAVSILVWEEVLEDRLIPKRWGVVVPGAIYRSGQLSPALVEKTLDEHGIELVVSLCADEPDDAEHLAEQQAVVNLGIERRVYPLHGDGTGDITYYAQAISDLLESKRLGRPVLVHCAAGASRTGGVVAAYRMLVEGVDPADAWAEMTRYDWDPDDPDPPRYLNENMAELCHLLVQMGVIEDVPDPLPMLAP